MYGLVKLFLWIASRFEAKEVSEEIDVMEKWTIGGENN